MRVSILKNRMAAILLVAMCTTMQAQEDYTQWVDPNIGTAHSRWFFYTPAAVPFGMAKPAPATNAHYGNAHGWDAVGYDHRHESIEGFPNLHEFQIGGIVFMASTGTLKTIPGKLENPEEGYRSRFDRKDEVADPGYYSVILKDHRIKAELTAMIIASRLSLLQPSVWHCIAIHFPQVKSQTYYSILVTSRAKAEM